MRKSNMQFRPGEPLSAAKHNGLVADAQAVAGGLGLDHAGNGAHDELRFERAWGVAEWDSVAQQWVGVQEDRLAFVYQLGSQEHLNVRLTIKEGYLTPEEVVPLVGLRETGVLAFDQRNRPIPIVEQRYAGAQDQGIWIELRPYDNSTRITVMVVGAIYYAD